MAHAKFSAFLNRMGAADLLQGIQSVGVLSLKEAFFKQKTAYAMESRDWSSDVCSSD
eukprot:COSAG03_NODE_24071_length_275_cov_0.579545_1_plen_56_part_10